MPRRATTKAALRLLTKGHSYASIHGRGAAALQAGNSIFSGIMGKSAAKKQIEAIRQAAETYNTKTAVELRSFRERRHTAGTTLAGLLEEKLDPDTALKASSLFKF